MSKEVKICEHCGAKMMEYTHSLNSHFVKSLHTLWQNSPPQNLKDIPLEFNDRNNFQKLRYWDFVKKHIIEGKHVEGVWDITERGILFLSCKQKFPKKVVTYRNERIYYKQDEMVAADELWSELSYKKRPQYIADWNANLFSEFN